MINPFTLIKLDDSIAKNEEEYEFWETILMDALVEQRRCRC